MEQVKEAVVSFVKGGDNNDASLLEKVLHPYFQNIQDGNFTEEGIFVFTKSQYIELVNKKTFGGTPRTINIRSIEQHGNIAVAEAILESRKLRFRSTIVCVRTDSGWQVINNIPKIEVLEKTTV